MRDGAFSVSAGYMNRPELRMRVAESVAEGKRIGKILFNGRFANAAKHRQLRIKEFDRLLVVHPAKIKQSAFKSSG